MYISFEDDFGAEDLLGLSFSRNPLFATYEPYSVRSDIQFILDLADATTQALSIDFKSVSAEPGPSFMETDLPADSSTPVTIGAGESHASDLENVSDIDWVAITVLAGQTYTIRVGEIAYMRFVDASGNNVSGATSDIDPDTGEEIIVYSATSNATYYLEIYGDEIDLTGLPIDYPLNYTASVSAVATPVDDYANDSSTTGSIVDGGTISGELHADIDEDWISVELVAGLEYKFEVDLNAFVNLVDANGVTIPGGLTDSDVANETTSLTIIPTVSDTYYLVIADNGGINNFPASYSISLSSMEPPPPTDDFSGDLLTTGVISTDGTPTAALIEENYDVDWFRVTVSAGEIVRFLVVDNPDNSPISLGLYDSAGTFIPVNYSSGDDFFRANIETGGDYFFSITGGIGTGFSPFSYEVTAEIIVDNHADDQASATLLTDGSNITGAIDHFDDFDWFTFTVGDYQGYEIDIINTGDPSMFVGVWVSNSDGLVIQQSDLNNSTPIYVDIPGTYYIEMFNQGEVGYDSGYSIETTVTQFVDDFAGDNTSSGIVAIDGGATTGNLEVTNDSDWFAFTAEAGQSVRFVVTNDQGFTGYSMDVRDANGLYISGGGSGSINSSGGYFETAGTYFLDFRGWIDFTGSYSITAVTISDDYANNDTTTADLPTNGTISGVLETDADSDWFEVSLTAGESFFVTTPNTGIQPFLQIIDSNGDVVAFDNYNNSARGLQGADYTATADGTYYVVAFAGQGEDAPYTLNTFSYIDDYADDTTTTGVLIVDGQALIGNDQSDEDTDWFRIDATQDGFITISVASTNDPVEGLYFYLEDSAEQPVIADPATGSYTVFAGNSYYVSVGGGIVGSGEYTISVSSLAVTLPSSIIPSPPARPTIPSQPEPLFYDDGGDPVIDSNTVIFNDTVNTQGPTFGGPYFIGPGVPLVYATNAFTTNAEVILTNDGTIWDYSDVDGAFAIVSDGLFNNGLIVAETATLAPGQPNFGSAVGVLLGGFFAEAFNIGEILAISPGSNATAVVVSGAATITNSGLIAAHATMTADTEGAGNATAIDAANGVNVINESSGIILAEGDTSAVAIEMRRGTSSFLTIPSIENHGLIEAQIVNGLNDSIGIQLMSLEREISSVDNYGTIRADIAINALAGEFSPVQEAAQTVTNFATGLIEGDIRLLYGDDALINDGTIIGNVDLSTGDDVFDSQGGSFTGIADLGDGEDIFIGSTGADYVMGSFGDDTLNGNDGRDLLLGGNANDIIDGGAGNDGLYGESGNDTIITNAADAAFGGLGNDRIETQDLTFASISGGEGHDIWVLPPDNIVLDLRMVGPTGRVTGIDEISLSGTQGLILDEVSISQIGDGNQLVVSGDSQNTVYLTGSWSQGGSSTINGLNYSEFNSGDTSTFVAEGIAVTTGNSPPVGTGLAAVGSGPAPLTPDDVEGVDLSGPTYEDVRFTIFDNFTINEGEYWHATNIGSIFGANIFINDSPGFDSGNIYNYGTIFSENDRGFGTFAGFAEALSLFSFNHFYNFGTVGSQAVGDGNALTFLVGSMGYITNQADGIIEAFTDAGDALAVYSFFSAVEDDDYSVINHGVIRSFSTTGFASGVRDFNGTNIFNDGTILAQGGNGALAVDMSNGGGGIFENEGTVFAYAPVQAQFFSIGVFFDGYSTLENQGTITADIAVNMRMRNGEQMIINNDGVINGAILLQTREESPFGRVDLTNDGTINGIIDISTTTTDSFVTNTGTINGDLYIGGGDDIYSAVSGTTNGFVFLGRGNDTATGGGGTDIIIGEHGNDNIAGGGGQDFLYGDRGNDTISGDAGDDYFEGGRGNDTLDGGAGTDVALYSLSSIDDYSIVENGDGSVTVTASSGNEGVDTLTNIEFIQIGSIDYNLISPFTENADSVSGNSGNNVFDALGGNDVVYGLAGDDLIVGNGGNDQLDGGTGNDILDGGNGIDTLLGGDGDDTILTGFKADIVDGGAGNDTVDYSLSDYAHVINLTTNVNVNGHANGDQLTNVENVLGSATRGDNITGDAGANLLSGQGGNDWLDGGNGVDTLLGGDGDDTILTGFKADIVDGGAGIDTVDYSLSDFAHVINLTTNINVNGHANGDSLTNIENILGSVTRGDDITGDAGDNLLSGQGGNDRLDGGNGVDILLGGDGDDTILTGFKADIVDGGAGIDTVDYSLSDYAHVINLTTNINVNGHANGDNLTSIENVLGSTTRGDDITGDAGANLLSGQGGNDLLDGGNGVDTLLGGDGDDTILTGFKADIVDGGAGTDTVDYSLSDFAHVINLTTNINVNGHANGDSLTSIENVHGSATRGDNITGDAGANLLSGQGGDDRLDGGNGTDTLLGGDGDDTILTGFKADIVDGGTGIDTVDYSLSDYAHVINLTSNVNINGHANGDNLTNIENVLGSNTRKDDITGNLLDNLLDGQGGNDTLRGGKGDDTLKGGVGDDSLFGGKGADVHNGGDGRDWAKYNGSSAFVEVDLINGGTAGIALGDTYISIENVRGTDFDDTILTNNDDNKIIAGKGNDIVDGRGGDDALQGNDGNDTLSGGTGNDTLKGQAGDDVFVFAAGDGVDKVLDFDDNGDDRIDLSGFGFASFADVQAIMTQIGSRVSIDFGSGDVLRLENTNLADMGADDFILSGGAAELPSAPKASADELPALNQDLIAQFMASNTIQSPITQTRSDGILEIMTDDDIGHAEDFEWDGFAIL